jgi:hypothetical protein
VWAQTTTTVVVTTTTTVRASTTTTQAGSTTTSIPPAALCQQLAARQAGRYVVALLACEEKADKAASRGAEFDFSACLADAESTYKSGIPKRIDDENCPPCIDQEMAKVAPRQQCLVPPGPHCDPSGGKAARKCGNRVTRLLMELVDRLVGCRVKAARRELQNLKFDEKACEKRQRVRYNHRIRELKNCPACLVTAQPADCWSGTVRLNNRSAYCDCVRPPGSETCEDNNSCTRDECIEHVCTHTPVNENQDCSGDDDDRNPCTASVCREGQCVHLPDPNSEGRACATNDRDDEECTEDICRDGACAHPPVENGTPCPDADPCNGEEACREGRCREGAELLCITGNPCTDGKCVTGVGCLEMPLTGPCEDGSACTLGDRCEDGECRPTRFLVCDDRDECTIDTCSSSAGCIFTPVPGCGE